MGVAYSATPTTLRNLSSEKKAEFGSQVLNRILLDALVICLEGVLFLFAKKNNVFWQKVPDATRISCEQWAPQLQGQVATTSSSQSCLHEPTSKEESPTPQILWNPGKTAF